MPDQTPQVRTQRAVQAGGVVAALAAVLIMAWEGLVPRTYPDPVLGWRVPTACWGHTGAGVIIGRRYTTAECRAFLNDDIRAHAEGIARCITVDVPPESMAAFVSFSFNVGVNAFCRSSIRRDLNAGNLRAACAGLSRWVYSGGRRIQGLANRRAAERALCERGL